MSKQRKPLDQILGAFDGEKTPPIDNPQTDDTDPKMPNSLAQQLTNPTKKNRKIRFTLDLEKPLDDRLTKSAKALNRTKADLVRFAVERLLEELEQ